MRTLCSNLSIVLLVIAGTVPVARARQQTPDQSAPIPAYHSPLASAADNGGDQGTDTQELAPDTRPLAGAQNFSLGTPLNRHNTWQPHFDLSSSLDSDPLGSSGQNGWTTWTSISGGIDVHRESARSDLTVNYLGGGMLSNSGNVSNGIIQQLSLKDKFSFRRSTISFFDQLAYLPENSFGFGGLGSTPLPGGGLLGSNFAPSGSILTTRGQNLLNSFVTEVDENLSPRTSLTFVGGYSLLHYFDSNQLDYGDANFQGGYNYQWTRKDAIGASYLFSAIRFSNFDQSITTHTISASYGRRITGRLAFQGSAGPQFAFFHIPIAGNTETSGASSAMRVYASAQVSLQYQPSRTGLAVTYSHGVNGGSGVLAGSLSDSVSGSVSRPLSRATSGAINFGYSRNSGLAFTTSAPVSQTYDYWFGGASLNRSLGRSLHVNLSYQAQYQTSSASFCIGPSCGTSVLRNLITFGVGWRRQPIAFE